MGAVSLLVRKSSHRQPVVQQENERGTTPPPSPPASNVLLLLSLAESSKEPESDSSVTQSWDVRLWGSRGWESLGGGPGGGMCNIQHLCSRHLLSTCSVSELVRWRQTCDTKVYRARSLPSRRHKYAWAGC